MSQTLSAQSALQQTRERIWHEWTETIQKSDTFALPQPDSLSKALTFTWTIPEELEKSAVMQFYYGTKGEKPQYGYPLFVYMHGSGPKMLEWYTGQKLSLQFEDGPSVYAIPRIPNEGELYRWWQKGKQWAWEKLLRRAFASGVVDPERVYFLGISEGGYGAQRLASFYADYLAGAGPMAGGEPLRNAPCENLSNTAFSLITGEMDYMFRRREMTENTSRTLDSLATLYPGEYTHRVELQTGRGHGIDYTSTTPWLSRYRRDAQPTQFRWENYEMDGVKRNSFYNIEVIEEGEAYRTYYDVRIKDNEVDISIQDVEYETTFTDPNWNIPFYFARHLTESKSGKLRVYLSEKLVRLDKNVTVRVNGKKVFKGKMKMEQASIESTMRQSLKLWGDPLRIFPACVEVEIGK